jgi:hypothetical protein
MGHNSFLWRFGAKIAARDGAWRCHYCGIGLVVPGSYDMHGPYERIGGYTVSIGLERPVVDHIEPQRFRFWVRETHHLSNLVLACRMCNGRKKAKPYDQFVAEITRWCREYDYPR